MLRRIFVGLVLSVLAACSQAKYHAVYKVRPSYSGFDRIYTQLYPLYEKDIKEAWEAKHILPSINKQARQFLGIDTFDLNSDGTKEIFVWFESGVHCGLNVCSQAIYQVSGDKLIKIDEVTVHGGPVILESRTNEYHDLAYYWWKGAKEFFVIYRWDGEKYYLYERITMNKIYGVEDLK